MAVTLSQLCINTEKSYDMKVIAGRSGMDNIVRWVHMIEDIEVSAFINGNDLVFTTGIAQLGTNWLLPYVQQLRKHGAVGLVINLGPYIQSVPPQLIVWCEEKSFPLFTIPWNVHIIDVTYDFCHRIIRSEETEVSIASAFKTLIFTPEKSDIYSDVLERGGFPEHGKYRIMAMYLQHDQQLMDDFSWKKLQYRIHRVLKKSHYPVCLFRQEQKLYIIRQYSSKTEMSAFTDCVQTMLSENGMLFSGVSEEQIGYTTIPILYAQAGAAADVAKMNQQSIAFYEEIGVFQLLYGIRDPYVLQSFYQSTLKPLYTYDAENHTDYTKVFQIYLQTGCSVQETSDQLAVHRNTVNYKIRQIKDALHIELDQDSKMRFMLAYLIRDMQE